MSNNTVSIIIPAFNSGKTISKCVESLLSLEYPDYEIIIVNDGSTDDTLSLLKNYEASPKLVIIDQPNAGPSIARNKAIKLAKGAFIAFTDADCTVKPDWLKELLKGFTAANPYTIMGVGGDQLSPPDESNFGKSINEFLKKIGLLSDYIKDAEGKTAIIETAHNPTCNVIYRKEIFDKIGYFDENLWPGEDVDLDYRIKQSGFKLMFNPSAVVYHYRQTNMAGYKRMMFRYGNVQAILVKRYGFFRKIQYVPFFLLFLIFSLVLACFVSILTALELLALQLLVFVAAFFINTKDFKKAFLQLYYLIITVGCWNMGFAAGMFSGKQKK